MKLLGVKPLHLGVVGMMLLAPVRAELNLIVPTEIGSGVTIKLSSPVNTVPHFGFMPVRVSVENLTTREGTWRFRFDAGTPRTFPGTASSVFEISAPATQTREAWFYVPLAGPGVTVNATALTAGSGFSAAQLPSAPPRIPGVYPNPAIPGVTHDEKRSLGTGPTGLTRTFTITQTGPAAALPPVPPSRLPPRASTSITPNSDGTVTRITLIPVIVNMGASAGGASINPATIAMTNARQELTKAGILTSGSRTSISVQLNPGAKAGVQEVTVTLKQTGPASTLPLPPASTLPTGFTAVNVSPEPGNPGNVVREFTYVENVSTLAPNIASGVAFPPARSLSSNDAQAEARKVLAPTKLLDPHPQVKTLVSTQYVSMSSTAAPGAMPSTPYHIVLFEQTGPAAALPEMSPAALPAGVRTTVFPGSGGDVTRIVSVIDQAVVIAMFSAAASASGAAVVATHTTNAARVELQRLGFLRTQVGVTLAAPITRSSGTPGAPSPDVVIYSESGPSNLLPSPPPHILPTGITCNVTPGALSGEVVRNFIVNIPGLLAGGGGATNRVPGRVATSGPGPRISGMAMVANTLTVEATGPGVPPASRTAFPSIANTTAMGPLATTPALEQVVRGKFSSSGSRSPPNIIGFELMQAPADWRVWSSFNYVLLTTDDFNALDAARRATLRTWIATGGVLFLSPETPGEVRTERIGAGRIETLSEPIADVQPSDIFSRLQLGSVAPGMPDRDRASFMPGTPIAETVKFEPVDTLWLSIFLIVFAALIGPVNVFLFAPATKRYRLFFTTPLIALLGAGAVALAIVLEDGIGGTGVRRTLVWFVPGESQAAIFQEQGARSGFLTRRDFPLDDGVLCAALPVDGNVHTYGGTNHTFMREAGHAGGDWFGNRSRQAQLLRNLVPTRARIEVVGTAPDGAPIVESTLTTELRDIRMRDLQGRTWSSPSVPTGRRVTLSPDAAGTFLATETNANGTPNLLGLMKEAATLTEPWQWVATGKGTDLAPIATLRSIRWTDDPIIYAGFAERAGVSTRSAAPAAAKGGD